MDSVKELYNVRKSADPTWPKWLAFGPMACGWFATEAEALAYCEQMNRIIALGGGL